MCLLLVGVALDEAILHEPSNDDDRDAGEGGRDESGGRRASGTVACERSSPRTPRRRRIRRSRGPLWEGLAVRLDRRVVGGGERRLGVAVRGESRLAGLGTTRHLRGTDAGHT